MRTSILVLNDVIGDFNFAVRTIDGHVVSARLFRAPSPLEQHFCLLAAVVEEFFQTRKSPWPQERSFLIAGLLEAFRNPATRAGNAITTPVLASPTGPFRKTNCSTRIGFPVSGNVHLPNL